MLKIDVYPPKTEYQKAAELGALADGLVLDPMGRLAAWMEALHVPAAEIDVRCGMPAGYVVMLRMDGDYRRMVRKCVRFLAEKAIEGKSGDVLGLFNEQIMPSVVTLMEVRDNPFSKDGDRVKAAVEFLDRAPDAPKVTKQTDERKVVITIPMRDLENMQKALMEEGSEEDVRIAGLLGGVEGKSGQTDEQFIDIAVEG